MVKPNDRAKTAMARWKAEAARLRREQRNHRAGATAASRLSPAPA
jgi:hypothetical protein